MERKVYKMAINKIKHPKYEGLETVSDVAKEMGLSSPATYQRIIRNGVHTWSVGNQVVIKTADIKKIK